MFNPYDALKKWPVVLEPGFRIPLNSVEHELVDRDMWGIRPPPGFLYAKRIRPEGDDSDEIYTGLVSIFTGRAYCFVPYDSFREEEFNKGQIARLFLKEFPKYIPVHRKLVITNVVCVFVSFIGLIVLGVKISG